jgi:hypothetical protein
MSQDTMLSLYDYLGKAAGPDLGKQVASYASIRKTKFGTKNISIPTFKGEIMLYTKEFLDEFFQVQKIFSNNA